MGAYAGTTTLLYNTVFGNKRISLLKADVTNYNATGVPLTTKVAGVEAIETVLVFFTGDLDVTTGPLTGSYVSASDAVFLYKASDTDMNDDVNLNSGSILVWMLVIGV